MDGMPIRGTNVALFSCVPLSRTVCLFVFLCALLSFSLHVFLSKSIHHSFCVYVCLLVCFSVCLPVCPSVFQSAGSLCHKHFKNKCINSEVGEHSISRHNGGTELQTSHFNASIVWQEDWRTDEQTDQQTSKCTYTQNCFSLFFNFLAYNKIHRIRHQNSTEIYQLYKLMIYPNVIQAHIILYRKTKLEKDKKTERKTSKHTSKQTIPMVKAGDARGKGNVRASWRHSIHVSIHTCIQIYIYM